MFITQNDYRVVVGEAALKTITQASPDIVETAEAEAIEEIMGYLRPQYDVDKIFSATDKERNPQIVMITVDIALYHMVSAMPQRMGSEVRSERYKRAVAWLEDVQRGTIVPNLPQATDPDTGSPAADTIRAGSSFRPVW